MCDRKSGAILSYRHYCQGTDKLSERGGFEWTSKAMDPISFGEMLNEMIDWIENAVDKLTEEFPDEVTGEPCLDSVVLDGDASTSSL
eukprot:6870681-Prymnesium_polylepis.1